VPSHRVLLLHERKLARSAFKALSKKQQVELQSARSQGRRAALAISSGDANRPKGILALICAAISSKMASTISVELKPGAMALAAMLNLAISNARVWVKAMMPPLLAA
jgi:precorrin-3B methylase